MQLDVETTATTSRSEESMNTTLVRENMTLIDYK